MTLHPRNNFMQACNHRLFFKTTPKKLKNKATTEKVKQHLQLDNGAF